MLEHSRIIHLSSFVSTTQFPLPSLYKSFFHLPFLPFLFPHFHSLTSAYRLYLLITSLIITIMQRLIVAVSRHVLRFCSPIFHTTFMDSIISLLFLPFSLFIVSYFNNICHLQLKLTSLEKFLGTFIYFL